MCSKPAFVNWYVGEGLKKDQCPAAREDFAGLEKGLREVAADSSVRLKKLSIKCPVEHTSTRTMSDQTCKMFPWEWIKLNWCSGQESTRFAM